MRRIDPALQAHLDGGATTLCDCWRIDRRDGVVFGFTDHDEDLAFDGVTFAARAALTGSAVERGAGLGPDNLEIMGALQSDAVSEEDVTGGLFDGAELRRWRVNWAAPEQRMQTFRGLLGEITLEDGAFRAEALGLSALLDRPIGRAFLPVCDAMLGDARCGAELGDARFRAEATVVDADGARVTITGLDGYAPGWFDGGRVEWLDGANAGVSVEIVAAAAGRLTLTAAPAGAIVAGDRVVVIAGCDRRASTCRDKFLNIANFRGFPTMPGDDWLTGGPMPGDVHDGGSRHG